MPLPPEGEVHVWTVDLDRPATDVARLGGLLTEDELLRAGAIKTEKGRSRAVVTRAAVRALLASYLDQARPEELAFTAGAHGKPRLTEPHARLHFNISHSAGTALIATATGIELGADIEQLRPGHDDLAGVARRVFSEAEREAAQGSQHAFLRHWTAKEAFVKAIGRGIGSLRSFEVLLDAPGGGARILHVGGDREKASEFTLVPLEQPASDCVGAIVAEHPSADVKPPRRFEP